MRNTGLATPLRRDGDAAARRAELRERAAQVLAEVDDVLAEAVAGSPAARPKRTAA